MGLFLTVLARAGVVLLTAGYIVWIVLELKTREGMAKTIGWESGEGPVSDFSFGWKLTLGVCLGLPVLAILWGLILTA